jgi:hypothetical protein
MTFPWYIVVAVALVAWHLSAKNTYDELAAAGFINGAKPAGASAASAGLLATGTAAGINFALSASSPGVAGVSDPLVVN